MGPSPQAPLRRKAGSRFPGITLPCFALLLSTLVWVLPRSFPGSLSLSPTAHLRQVALLWGFLPPIRRAGSELISPSLAYARLSMKHVVDLEVRKSLGASIHSN